MIEILESSTIHGVSHIHGAKSKITKILWIFLFIFGIIGIFVNIVLVILNYFSNPILTRHTLDHEPFIWPDITFCKPTAPFYLAKISDSYDHWTDVLRRTRRIVERLANETEVFKIIQGQKVTDYELEERTVAMSSADPYKLKVDQFQNHIYDLFINQMQSGIVYHDDYSGMAASFFNEDLNPLFTVPLVQIRNNIPCYTFHIDKSKSLNQNEIRSISFYLKFNIESYMLFNSSYLQRSVFLYITNRDEIPQRNAILLTPGFKNIVSLAQSRYKYKGIQRKCRNNNYQVELYDALLLSTLTLEGNYEDCKKIESQRMIVSKCKCYSPFLPIFKNETGPPRICLNATFYSEEEIIQNAKCMAGVFATFQSHNRFAMFYHINCKHFRLNKCDEVKYKREQYKESFVELWSGLTNQRREIIIKGFADDTVGKIDTKNHFEQMRDNFIELVVKREFPKGDLYSEESEYSCSELLSDIGGLMGLWLGMSVVGLFEIFQLIYLYLLHICCHSGKHQVNSEKHDTNTASVL